MKQRHEGVVIVVALFVLAIIAAMATTMLAHLSRDTRRTNLILNNVQSELHTQGAVFWARDVLRQNWEKQSPDRPVDVLPLVSSDETAGNYHIQNTLSDLQARFNLNNLTRTEAQTGFKRLLKLIQPELAEAQATAIMKATIDWITPGLQRTVFDEYYLSRPVPYRSSHQPMNNMSELRLVKGVTPALYTALLPHVYALPGNLAVNVQTASPAVLFTIDPKMSIDAANAIVTARQHKPFLTTQAFLANDIVKNNGVRAEQITTISHYFLLETIVTIDQQKLITYTLLQRVPQDKKAKVNVIWQSKGTW
jgi:general secretion pathway protein K